MCDDLTIAPIIRKVSRVEKKGLPTRKRFRTPARAQTLPHRYHDPRDLILEHSSYASKKEAPRRPRCGADCAVGQPRDAACADDLTCRVGMRWRGNITPAATSLVHRGADLDSASAVLIARGLY